MGKEGKQELSMIWNEVDSKTFENKVEMMVNGKRTIADFVAEDVHGKCMCLK